MYLANNWLDYEIIDAGNDEKLERWGDVVLLRPDPQAIWPMKQPGHVDAHYIRSNSGGGSWNYYKQLPESWTISYRDLRFIVRPTGFKHTGLFPEQAVNWDFMREAVEKHRRVANRPFRALNLFAYTGAASCALAAAGAEVVHVDAAKGMIAWAKNNLAESGLADRPVRFIVDDVMKFVQREKRRGRSYEGILMDPPSYGRGPDGEMWRIESGLYPLVSECMDLLSDDAGFFIINSYTTGLAPAVLRNVLKLASGRRGGRIDAQEIGIPITNNELVLPCGCTARWYKEPKA